MTVSYGISLFVASDYISKKSDEIYSLFRLVRFDGLAEKRLAVILEQPDSFRCFH